MERLLALYAAAVLLPSAEPPEDAKEPASQCPPEGWQTFEGFETYWEVFDPYALQEPVAGSLSDDLLDVFRNVRRGLSSMIYYRDAQALCDDLALIAAVVDAEPV